MKNEPWWSDITHEELIKGIQRLEEENGRLHRIEAEHHRHFMEGGWERVKGENEVLRGLVVKMAKTLEGLPSLPDAIREEMRTDKSLQSVLAQQRVEIMNLHWILAKSFHAKVGFMQGLKGTILDYPVILHAMEELLAEVREQAKEKEKKDEEKARRECGR